VWVQAAWGARRFFGVLVRSAEVMDTTRILGWRTQPLLLSRLFP
jgi:hypothetical protein